jgi:hypothetical protein
LYGYFPKGYSRRIEEILEHACNRCRLTVKKLNEWDGPSILQVESTQCVRSGADGTQGVTQFMREHGDELVLLTILLL